MRKNGLNKNGKKALSLLLALVLVLGGLPGTALATDGDVTIESEGPEEQTVYALPEDEESVELYSAGGTLTLDIGAITQLTADLGTPSHAPVGTVNRNYLWDASGSLWGFDPANVLQLNRSGRSCTVKTLGPGRVVVSTKVCMSYNYYDAHLKTNMPAYEEAFAGSWIINVTQPYTVTFDTQGTGTTSDNTKIVFSGMSYGTLPSAARNGYTFDGWYTQPEGGDQITSDTVVSLKQDHTLYAHWTPVPGAYTVSFDTQYKDSVSLESKVVFAGEAYGALPETERDTYTFDGWYTHPEGGEQVTAETIVTLEENHTLYAHWTHIPGACIVTFEPQSSAYLSQKSRVVTMGQTYGELPTLNRNHFRFDGWFTQPENGEQVTAETVVALEEDHSLYAHWTRTEPAVVDGQCGENAFWHFDKATGTLTISGSGSLYRGTLYNQTIGSQVQSSSEDKIRHLVVEDGITVISQAAFSACTGLESVTMGDGIRTIETDAFRGCTKLTRVSFSNNLTSIAPYAFYACSCLRWLNLPESLTTISDSAFVSCKALTNVVIPDNVQYIGETAFFWCDNLTSVYWPSSLRRLGYAAFDGCDNLHVYYGGTSEQLGAVELRNKIWNYYVCSNDYLNNMPIKVNASPLDVLIEPESAVYIDDGLKLAGRLLVPARTDYPLDKRLAYVAAYDKNGQCLGIDSCENVYFTDGNYGMLLILNGSIPVEDSSGLTVKVYILDETHIPLCDVTVYQFE